MRRVWKWSWAVSIAVGGLFLVVDLAFFGANLFKVFDGGWLPLSLGALIFVLMAAWRAGIDAVRASAMHASMPLAEFQAMAARVPRTPGTEIFLSRQAGDVPSIIVDHVRYMGVLPEHVIALTVTFEPTPRIPDAERCDSEAIAPGLCHVTARFGFVESPDLEAALRSVGDLEAGVDLDHAVIFANRDLAKRCPTGSRMPAWQLPIFTFLFRNAVKTVDRFNLPPDKVVEVSHEVQI
jgi:KUP system potassium uptake protein